MSEVPGPEGRTRADPGPPDDELIARIQANDESALETLIARHWSALVGYARAFLPTVEEAEDIVQEAFVRLWQRRSVWVTGGSIRNYLYTTVRNLSLNARERRSVSARWAESERHRPVRNPTPLDLLEDAELVRALDAAILELPERRREVFVLACVHGLSYREVADTLGIAVPTVANQVSAALKSVREALREVSGRSL